jgi:hypothetical protein
MRLVASSNPDDVDRFEAIDLLVQRAVLTRMVCRELAELPDGRFSRWRASTAHGFLMSWISSLPGYEGYPKASFDIDAMAVPDDCTQLLEEIRDGARVCEALAMLQSADTASDFDNDMRYLKEALDAYWQQHPSAAQPPPVRLR